MPVSTFEFAAARSQFKMHADWPVPLGFGDHVGPGGCFKIIDLNPAGSQQPGCFRRIIYCKLHASTLVDFLVVFPAVAGVRVNSEWYSTVIVNNPPGFLQFARRRYPAGYSVSLRLARIPDCDRCQRFCGKMGLTCGCVFMLNSFMGRSCSNVPDMFRQTRGDQNHRKQPGSKNKGFAPGMRPPAANRGMD
jgi:hypothetical protein